MTDRLEDLAEALREDFVALLADADVNAIAVDPAGGLVVTRRGRREVIAARASEKLVAAVGAIATHAGVFRGLLLDASSTTATARLDIAKASGAAGGFLTVETRAPIPRGLSDLADAGELVAEVIPELVSNIVNGAGIVSLGPSREGALRLALAIGHDVAPTVGVFSLEGTAIDEGRERVGKLHGAEELPRGLPPFSVPHVWPAPEGRTVVDRARRAADLGAAVVLAVDLSTEELESLLAASIPVVLIAHVRAANAEAVPPQNHEHMRSIALTCVVGVDPRGSPRIGALIGGQTAPPPMASTLAPPAAAPIETVSPVATIGAPSEGFGGLTLEAPGLELPPLVPLGPAPPDAWNSEEPEMDPGWDLGENGAEPTPPAAAVAPSAVRRLSSSLGENATPATEPDAEESSSAPVGGDPSTPSPSASGSFSDTLKSIADRPSFKPRKPSEHPQTKKLREDPFGGLTFEPPRSDVGDGESE